MNTEGRRDLDSNAGVQLPTANPFLVGALAQLTPKGFLLQDFKPFAESLEWELGQKYWEDQGGLAFTSDTDSVPYVVNNTGALSARAARLLFASLESAKDDSSQSDEIYVLEMGVGSGLFARFFLDYFRHICLNQGRNYYDRLCYVCADRSLKMLRDLGRNGIFQNHPGRYRLVRADAQNPTLSLKELNTASHISQTPFQAVFLNYVVDCLPACCVRLENNQMQMLFARTMLANDAGWQSLIDISSTELRRRAASEIASDRQSLSVLFDLLFTEYAFRPVDLANISISDFIGDVCRQNAGKPILHNHGAIESLTELLKLITESGFILINDYGQSNEVTSIGFEHQRFSRSTAVGVNFALLRMYFNHSKGAYWTEPQKDDVHLFSRLLKRQLNPELERHFEECFGEPGRRSIEMQIKSARDLVQGGRSTAALVAYRQTLQDQPFDWMIMNELAHFLCHGLRDHKSAMNVARAGLKCNPNGSADLWNTYGDALYGLNKVDDAKRAFMKALEISPQSTRSRLNLAYVYLDNRQHSECLLNIAEGLSLDKSNRFRDSLLQKQAECLRSLDMENQSKRQNIANRIIGFDPKVPIHTGNDDDSTSEVEQVKVKPSKKRNRGKR